MCKVLSRDVLKIIAVLAMLIDHIGKLFFPEVLFLQILGRLAFPIFAFFIAEGFYYTKNKVQYLFTILVFAVIAQIPYNFLWHGLNVLFTFICALVLLFLWEASKRLELAEKVILRVITWLVFLILSFLALVLRIDYQWYGILLPFVFYLFRERGLLKFLLFAIMTVLFVIQLCCTVYPAINFNTFIQLFALLSILPLSFYDNQRKSNKKIKYLFYVFYPLHLVVLLCLTFVV